MPTTLSHLRWDECVVRRRLCTFARISAFNPDGRKTYSVHPAWPVTPHLQAYELNLHNLPQLLRQECRAASHSCGLLSLLLFSFVFDVISQVERQALLQAEE